MTEDERKELEELTEKCIDKRNNKPKKNALLDDLERLDVLQKAVLNEETEARGKAKLKEIIDHPESLNSDERAELEDLEKRAKQGRNHPEPHEMRRLGVLRIRAKANK